MKNQEIRNIAIVAVMATLIAAAAAFTTSESVFAYNKNQAKSDVNSCGNGVEPTNVGCQNTDSQIQGDGNVVALSAEQIFQEPPTTGTLTVIKEVRCQAGISGCPVAEDFLMRVTVNNVLTTFAGEPAPGTQLDIEHGTYFVDETSPPPQQLPPNTINTESKSIDCEGTISAGGSKTCTITNTISLQDIVREPIEIG